MKYFIAVLIQFGIILQYLHRSKNQPVPPNLTYQYAPFDPKQPMLSPDTQPILYFSPSVDLYIHCQAPYPIQWKFDGYIFPPEIVKLQAPIRNLANNIFILVAWFAKGSHTKIQKHLDVGASVGISCQMIENPEINSTFFYFARENNSNPFVTFGNLNVSDSTLIPCATKDPNLTPLLYRHNASTGNKDLISSSDLIYKPTDGFSYKSKQLFDGVYICEVNSFGVTVTATSTFTFPNYHVSPLLSLIRVFTENIITLECLSKSLTDKQPPLLTVENTFNFLNISYNQTSFGSIVSIQASSNLHYYNDTVKTKAVCWTGFEQHSHLIKEWNIEFVQTPKLYLENSEGNVVCYSELGPELLQTVGCKNPMDCQFKSRCFESEALCTSTKQTQVLNETELTCWREDLGRNKNCIVIRPIAFQGLVQCTVRGLTKRWWYFVSLDFLKYTNLLDAPTNELIRIDNIPPVLYTNASTQLTCVAVAYFSEKLYFELEFRNGTKILLDEESTGVNFWIEGDEHRKSIRNFNIIAVLHIWLPVDATGISCVAPGWNTTDYVMQTKQEFVTKDLSQPKIGNGAKVIIANFQSKSFLTGKLIRKLVCYAGGQESSEYEWYFENELATKVFPELLPAYVDSTGANCLELPETAMNNTVYEGEWKCVPKNIAVKHEGKSMSVCIAF